MSVQADALIAAWAEAAAPPPDYTVSQWADAERMLPETSGARGSRWRTEAVPYLRGVMDAVHEPGVQKIALRKASQIGGSEALHNILGFFIQHQPSSMLFVHPTAGQAEEWSKERLSDLIRSTPALRDVVREGRQAKGSHEAESTLGLKMFPGGYLALGGAKSPNTFARRSVRIVFGDDIDRFGEVTDEGDPIDLMWNRTESFDDALGLFVSTPTLKGGRIDTLYERSDRRQFHVRCPVCDRVDYITWRDQKHFHVSFDAHDPETARITCPAESDGGCGAQLDEADRRAMLMDGVWLPTAPAKEPGLVGFHLPAMLATIGSRTLPSLVEKWLAARQKGKESLRVFVNTQLAEGWEERGTKMESTVLATRREDYGTDVEVPFAAAALTCGVDVQADRFELQVQAWGPGNERWVVDYRAIPGDPKQPETRAALLEALGRRYQHASGHQLPIHATCIDSGYATEEVYSFVLANQVRRIYATKGIAGRGGNPIVLKPSEVKYGKNPRPVRLYPVNVDDAKTDIMTALTLAAPGPGYMHFPLHVDTVQDEYFAQLCAEHKETRYNRSGIATHTVWVLDRERNEALDTAVLCLAAFKLLNPNLRQMQSVLVTTAVPVAPADPPTEPPPGPPPSAAPTRRPRRHSHMRIG